MPQEPEEYFRGSFKKCITCEGGEGEGSTKKVTKSDTSGKGCSKKSDVSHSNFLGFSICATQFFSSVFHEVFIILQ